jgi:putative methionine-R-sulfoxide reductase with GAF domain
MCATTGVQSEACVPILDEHRAGRGIVDAEAKPRGFFGAQRLAVHRGARARRRAVLP